MSFPNREGGGGPPLGKNSYIFPFFSSANVPYDDVGHITNVKIYKYRFNIIQFFNMRNRKPKIQLVLC